MNNQNHALKKKEVTYLEIDSLILFFYFDGLLYKYFNIYLISHVILTHNLFLNKQNNAW